MRKGMNQNDRYQIEQAMFRHACGYIDLNQMNEIIDSLGYSVERDDLDYEIQVSNKLTGWVHRVSC